MSDDTLEKNYMDANIVNGIRSMIEENDLVSLADKMIEYFPELDLLFEGTVSQIKEAFPEIEKEISDLTFIRQIKPEHRNTIKEIYDTGDMISMHKKFLADFPEDTLLINGSQSIVLEQNCNGSI